MQVQGYYMELGKVSMYRVLESLPLFLPSLVSVTISLCPPIPSVPCQLRTLTPNIKFSWQQNKSGRNSEPLRSAAPATPT
jgi:hypothetical protein